MAGEFVPLLLEMMLNIISCDLGTSRFLMFFVSCPFSIFSMRFFFDSCPFSNFSMRSCSLIYLIWRFIYIFRKIVLLVIWVAAFIFQRLSFALWLFKECFCDAELPPSFPPPNIPLLFFSFFMLKGTFCTSRLGKTSHVLA